jgi:protein TonB
MLPSALVSWAISLLLHGGGVLAICFAAHWFFEHAHPPARWGGGGGRVSLVAADSSSSIQTGIPGVVSLPDSSPQGSPSITPDAPSDSTPSFNSSRTLDELTRDTDNTSEPRIIGVLGVGADLVVPKRHGGADGIARSTKATANGVLSPTGNGTGDSHAGLPGALLSKGLPTPDYPPEARRRGQQGVVKVALEVLPDGQLGDIRIVSDASFRLLGKSAMSAAQKLREYRFIPARKFGQTVCDYIILPYNFILQ